MNNMHKYLSGLLILGCLTAAAQTKPKLALAGVAVTPTLASKFAAPAATTNQASANADLVGVWSEVNIPSGKWGTSITIEQGADGLLHSSVRHQIVDHSFLATDVIRNGRQIKLTYYNDFNGGRPVVPPNPNTVEGEVNPTLGVMQVIRSWSYQGKKHSGNLTLHRTTASPASVSAPPVSLADLTHSLNVQLFDRFKGEQFFNVMGDAELKQAIAPTGQPPNPPYDFANPSTAAQFKKADIQYVLVTSLEDFSNQTVEKRRSKDFHYQTGVYNRTSTFDARSGRNGFSSASTVTSAKTTTQGGLDPEVWQQQTIRLTVRGQLFDATTGEMKKSTTGIFPCQRDYTAVAQGKNELSTSDLCAAAADKVSEWAALLVDDAIFPIRVLAKNEQEITISRGSDGGLQVGQVFEVCIEGELLRDPDHKDIILGRPVKVVGRVAISKLDAKFSQARVLEDKGIVTGATLARVAH